MVFAIVGVFVFCNAFESIVWILASQEKISLDLIQDYLRPLGDLLMIINSSVNICIYGYFNYHFKEKFLEMYLWWLPKKDQNILPRPNQVQLKSPQISKKSFKILKKQNTTARRLEAPIEMQIFTRSKSNVTSDTTLTEDTPVCVRKANSHLQ